MTRAVRALVSAFGYFSIVPMAGNRGASAPTSETLLALPLVGAAVGAAAALGARVVGSGLGPRASPAVAFGLSVVLSGAIHVDGFLDTSDALFASTSPARRLEILKDPHHGSFAIAAMAVATAAWLAALDTAARRPRFACVLAYAAALARYAAIVNARIGPPPAGTRSTAALAALPRLDILVAEGCALTLAGRALGPRVWPAVPASVVASLALARPIARAFGGGLAGDAYGFLIVALEPAIVAFVTRSIADPA